MRPILVANLTVLIALLAAGCGSDSNPANTLNSVIETGSASLLVNAEIKGTDAGSGLFVTEFNAAILDSLGAPVTSATVTISHAGMTTANLTWDTLTASTYTASASGYLPGIYTLNVTRGTDFIANATVSGPAITYPTLTDTIPLNTAITTLWTRTAAAQEVEVETRDYGPVLSSSVGDTDDGSFLIPGSQTIRDDQRVRITRSNSVVLTRGLAGLYVVKQSGQV
jgi:hypothetical protein